MDICGPIALPLFPTSSILLLLLAALFIHGSVIPSLIVDLSAEIVFDDSHREIDYLSDVAFSDVICRSEKYVISFDAIDCARS